MAKKKRNELTAGLFVVTALVLLVGVVLWMGAADILRPAAQHAYFWVGEDKGAVGLEVGNAVKINDETIGKIVDVTYRPEAGDTLYVAEIQRSDRAIYRDAEAHPDVPFIGGGRLVVTCRGTESKGKADKDHPVKLGTGGLMGTLSAEMDKKNKDSLVAKLDAIVTEVKRAAEQVSEIAGIIRNEVDPDRDGSTVKLIKKSLANVNEVTASIREQTNPDNKESLLVMIRKTIASLQQAATDIEHVTRTGRPKVDKIITDLADTTGTIKKLAQQDVVKILADLRQADTHLLKALANLSELTDRVMVHKENIDETIDNLAQVSVNLKATSKEVRRHPWKLLYTPKKGEEYSANIAAAARDFAQGASELDQTITRLSALAKMHPKGIPGDDPQLKEVRKKLEDAFAKFSRVEEALWNAAAKEP